MNNKDNYTPKEVAGIVNAYAQLMDWDKEIGGGRRIAMPGLNKFREDIKECVYAIPENVVEGLSVKSSKLEKSLYETIERSRS